ncbi:hypothetical protein ACM9HF_20045 [Colwellia sp. RE-S-Sl-9]
MLKTLWIILFLIITNKSYAKSKCEVELNELQHIQSLLRHKTSEYLRDKEHKAHEKYQICRSRKNNQSSNNKSKKIYSKKTTTKKKYYPNQYVKKSFGKSTVKIKGKFKGDKQNAWIEYYKTPKECIKPKSTSQFASCLNKRNVEAERFSTEWDKHHQ